VADPLNIWRFQRTRAEIRRRHPHAHDEDITDAAYRQVHAQDVDDELAGLDAKVIGEEYAQPPDQPDPADEIRRPELRRAYRIERRRSPHLSHFHLMNFVLMRLAQDPEFYSTARLAADRRSQKPSRYDSCKSCTFYHSFLDKSLKAGNCGHPTRLGRTTKEENICEEWHA
jgi:hypothetical protein